MLSPQPIQLVKYLGLKRNIIPVHLNRLFYLSYEDALWDILENKKVKKGSQVLVPSFFCEDVEENIKTHGYKIVRYEIFEDLSANSKDFIEKIIENKPAVVIVFHPVGITSNLFTDRKWINLLSTKTILIEDCVHRLIDPKNIKIYKPNHFLINSLRKVVPLQGSSVYGSKTDLDFSEPPFAQSLSYSLKVHFLWMLMVLSWNIKLRGHAEKLMIKGYDLIGDSMLPAKGFWIFKILEEFLDYEKINKIKYRQAEFYQKKLGTTISIAKSDLGNLRGYPVYVETLDKIRKMGLAVRFELNRKIIYLPMGPYITKSDQNLLANNAPIFISTSKLL